MTTASEVKSAAELERLRLATQAAQARAAAEAQARQAESQTEIQAREAISKTEQQAQAVRSEVSREAESRQAEIRKQRGQAEREAESAKAIARKAQRVEQRKVVLPTSKPRDLGLTLYIANVETARRQAQQAGASAKAAVTKVRDDYFEQVDKARDAAIVDINKQKAGIISDIQTQLVNINADITKQLANANSGIDKWEAESKAKIAKAQADYEAAMKAAINKSGTEVLADMKDKGLISSDATLVSYDKNTGQITYSLSPPKAQQDAITKLETGGFVMGDGTGSYTINVKNEAGNLADIATIKAAFPDLSTSQISDLQTEHDAYTQMQNDPQASFKRLQDEGKVPSYAVYKSIDTKTGEVTYEIPAWSTIGIDKIRPTNAERTSLTGQYTDLMPDSQAFIAQAALGRTDFIVHDTKDGFELLGIRGKPSLSADDKDRVLAYYKEQILASDNPPQAINDLYTNIVKAQRAQLKSAAIGMIPVYGTIKQWGEMSTAGRVASVTMDVVFIASLVAAGIQSGFFKSIGSKIATIPEKGATAFREIVASYKTNPEAGFIRLGKSEVTRGGYLKPVTVQTLSAEDVGMSSQQFDRFLAARVKSPSLTPETFKVLDKMSTRLAPAIEKIATTTRRTTVQRSLEQIRGYGTRKAVGTAEVSAEEWAKMFGAPSPKEAAARAGSKFTVSPSEARAFYGSLLPSYAEIIAQGLPSSEKWKPVARTFTASETNIPSPRSYLQSVTLMSMDSKQWANLASSVIPSKLPKNVQPEIVVGGLFGLANDAATTAAAISYAQALQQGKTKTQAQTASAKAASQVLANALTGIAQSTQGLTKVVVKAMAKTLNKGVTQAKVNTATKTITDAMTETATQTQVQTETGTETGVGTGIGGTGEGGGGNGGGKGGKAFKPPDKDKKSMAERPEYPDGTIVWKMGETKKGDVYKIIPPPYTMPKPITSKHPPKGMTKTKGTPQETLTFIGGKVPFENVSFDLGVTDGFIDVKAKKIKFTGGGEKTNVGTRIESTTKGVALKHNLPIAQVSNPTILDVGAGDRPMPEATHAIDTEKPKKIPKRLKEYHVGDFQNPPKDWKGKFDKIVSRAALGTPSDEYIEYFKSPKKTGKALDFVTKPNATLEIETANEYTPEVRRILKASKFEITAIEAARGPHGGVVVDAHGNPAGVVIKATKINQNSSFTTELARQPRVEIAKESLTKPRIERVPARPRRGKLVSHGVYADKGNQRITRKHHRGWRRIY
jgi:hypothetical protein